MRIPLACLLVATLVGCGSEPDDMDSQGATSGQSSATSDPGNTSVVSGITSTTDPCGTAGCGPIEETTTLPPGNTTEDCGTGDCCDVNPNFCGPTESDTETLGDSTTVGPDTDGSSSGGTSSTG